VKHRWISVPPQEAALIVELFAKRQARYTEADVFRLTLVPRAQLEEEIANGAVEPRMKRGERWYAWPDVAHLAYFRWRPRMVMEALRDASAGNALPTLNQTYTIQIEVPLYEIRLLHWLALQESEPGGPQLTASDVAERALNDLAENTREEAERDIRGFLAARNFPVSNPTPQIVKSACMFCGTALLPGEDAICRSCQERHVPANGHESDRR
jgi:hypothetical protein